jgi:hypothetical protein
MLRRRGNVSRDVACYDSCAVVLSCFLTAEETYINKFIFKFIILHDTGIMYEIAKLLKCGRFTDENEMILCACAVA